MFTEHRRRIRPGDPRERAKVDRALSESKRLIAEIDALLERSYELMSRQALLHRSWR